MNGINVILAVGLAGLFSASFIWQLANPPRPLGWTPPTSWMDRTAGRMDTWLRRRWNVRTRQQAEILALPSWRVLGFYALAALGGGLVGYDLLHGVIGAIVIGGLLAWKGPAWLINRQFQTRRATLARDFPPLVLMLRIYLDLGEPLAEALKHTRPALSRLGRHELDRLLSGIDAGTGDREVALKQWARRSGIQAYALLADTLAQGWGQGLTAESLVPLDTLIQSSREQGTRALTERLDGMATFVPVIAAFGVMAVLLYAMLAGSGIF